MQTMPKEIPSFRKLLVQLNSDLFEIARRAPFVWHDDCRLTEFEVMVLILEDRRFFYHYGFDTRAIMREALKALFFRRHGGASTIDMQLVRTLTGYKSITFRRKIYEIMLSILIQFHYSKLDIFRIYLLCAYFGYGLKGAESAALKLYGKQVSDLDVYQTACLAAMLVYPCPKKINKSWEEKVIRRANYVLALRPRLRDKMIHK